MYQTFTKNTRRTKGLLRSLLFMTCMMYAGISFGQSYCTPTVNNHCCGMGAVKVELDNGSAFSKSTTYSNSQSYFDYYNTVSGCVAPGSSYTLDVTVGPTYNHSVCIWVDWNKDGVFDNSTSSDEKIDSVRSTNPNSVFSATLNVPNGLSAGPYRMRVLCDYYYYYSNAGAIFDPCNAGGTYTYGGFQDYQLLVPSSSEDIKLVSINKPAVLTTGNNDVEVTIKNLSTTTIDSVRFSYQLDNGSIVTESMTGLGLATCATYTYQFNTALNIANGGTFTLKTWANYPNGVSPDANPNNDSMSKTICTGISGNFTIDAGQASSATNFTSFTDAVNALNTCGITGPVTFTVATGTYNENIAITNVNGSSSSNTITFDGVDFTTRKITSSQPYTIKLDGADYVTIKNLEIECTSSSQMTTLHLTNDADWNFFDSLLVTAPTNNYSATAYGVMGGNTYSYGNYGDNNTIDHSEIKGGYYTTVINGTSTSNRAQGNSILNSFINNNTGYAGYYYYNDTLALKGCYIKCNYTMFEYCSNVDLLQNTFEVNNYGYPIYSWYCSNMNIINNSMSGSNMYYGMYAYYLSGANIYHNSFYSNYSYSYGTYIYQGTNLDMRNNHFWMNGTNSLAIYVQSAGNFTACEYNNYYCPNSSNLLYIGQTYQNLASVIGQGGLNNIANNQAPNFVNTSSAPYDLHLTTTTYALFGDGSVGVSVDIDGDTRCSMAPSVGCDESKYAISVPVSDFTVSDTFYVNSPMNALNAAALNQGKVFDWGIDGSFGIANTLNFNYTFTSPGTYAVSLITTNCAGSDTVTKNVVIIQPTTKPTPDFLADRNIIESNESVKFNNLTIGGDTAWYWTVTQGTQGVDWDFTTGDAYSYNAEITFITPGKYEVCLQAWNMIGDDKV
ncbi:MAG: PKD domain-containing protein, partial [Bacteroidetes bacterium]|nr:PKD domain-containing protein [Bacteroidota bacterium]